MTAYRWAQKKVSAFGDGFFAEGLADLVGERAVESCGERDARGEAGGGCAVEEGAAAGAVGAVCYLRRYIISLRILRIAYIYIVRFLGKGL